MLDDLLNTHVEAIEVELKALHPAPPQVEPRQQPKRVPLPPQFPRTVIHHKPDTTSALAAASFSGSVKMSARSWTTHRAFSPHNCIVLRQFGSDYAIWRFSKDGQDYSHKVSGTLSSNDGEVA